MVKIILFTLILINNAYALQGQVIGLDVPLFKEQSTKSKIIQYVKKGDMIYLHPSAGKKRSFTKHAPKGMTEEQVVDDTIDVYNSDFPDPMFGADIYNFDPENKFYQTLDNRGRPCYVLKRHMRIIYNDVRELDYITPEYDDTDYRLREPLPKKYPLLNNLGHRGMFLGGIGQQNHTRIPTTNAITSTEQGYKFDFEMFWLKNVEFDKLERFYFGAMASYTYFQDRTERFNTNTNFNETYDELMIRISIGPVVYYDAWKYQKQHLSTYFSFLINIFQHKFIDVEDFSKKYSAEYSTFTISPATGLHYSVNDFFAPDYDFVSGISARYNFPTTYNVAGKDTINLSSYESSANLEVSFNIGIKSDF